jgi:hypothetical protein
MTKDLGNRFGWLMVLGATLTMSDYSLYFVARHFGTPPVFAILAGVIFDGAALLFADYSLKHARAGSSGSGPRLAVLICAGLSAFLNSQHAVIANQIPAARIFWAAPPVIAVLAYEFHIKWERRRALANAGRVPPDLPAFGKWAWLLFPVKTWRIARNIVRFRLGITLARHTPGIDREGSPVPVTGSMEITAGNGVSGETFLSNSGTFLQTRETFGELGERNPSSMRDARDWARASGYPVNVRGPLPANVLRDYIHAINSANSGGESGETPETAETDETNEIDGKETG